MNQIVQASVSPAICGDEQSIACTASWGQCSSRKSDRNWQGAITPDLLQAVLDYSNISNLNVIKMPIQTLAMLCSALAWQKYQEDLLQLQIAVGNKKKKKAKAPKIYFTSRTHSQLAQGSLRYYHQLCFMILPTSTWS